MNERTTYRVKQVIIHTEKLKKRKEKQLTTSLLSVGLVLTSCLISMFGLINNEFQSRVMIPDLYGAVLLYENAGGYVFVAISAFILGIIITLGCIHFKNKK